MLLLSQSVSVSPKPQRSLLLICSILFCLPLCSMTHVVPTTPLVTFLERVQHTALRTHGESNTDPKFYVDMSLKHDLSAAEAAFDGLPESPDVSELNRFLREYFDGAGEDLVDHEPEDFVPEPEGFLPKVENEEVRAWAIEVHSLWRRLSKRVSDSVRESPERHTLIPLPEPVIVPGSRFREIYYWDSYWVVRGLLASKMHTTAKAIVYNLIFLVDKYGFVLNGAREYYTNRSQPPLLSSMVLEIYNRTGDMELIRKSLPALLKEYRFWNSGMHQVRIKSSEAETHVLNRYYAMWDRPRPESSTIDQEIASKLLSAEAKQRFYRELATTAESGWDFSSRWMKSSSDLTTLSTTSVLPVDLNVILLKMELDIAFLAETCGNSSVSAQFSEASHARKQAIVSVFWNNETGQWLDYWLSNNTKSQTLELEKWEASNQNRNVFASNFIPLWIRSFNSDHNLVERVTEALRNSGLLRSAGIVTSLENSGQQWDFPNGWAPLQHMIVEGLLRSGSEEARSTAEDIAMRWIRSNHAAYKKTGAMHEKLDVENCGEFGGGGEYAPQTGFGWSNGVLLAFLEEFGWPQHRKIGLCQSN